MNKLQIQVTTKSGERTLVKDRFTVKETLLIAETQKKISKLMLKLSKHRELVIAIQDDIANSNETSIMEKMPTEVMEEMSEFEHLTRLEVFEMVSKLFEDVIDFNEEVLFNSPAEFSVLIDYVYDWLGYVSNANEEDKKKMVRKLKGQ